MRRRTFDVLVSWVGVLLVVALVVAGGLLMWGYNFANSNVTDQLTAQKIFFPPAGSEAISDPQIAPYLNQYAGQQLTTGAQAGAYANHFIAVHLKAVADGKTYAEVSAAALEDPENAELQAQKDTLFRGQTLRSMLLNAYAFWKFGQIALWGAIGAFLGAGIMLILTLLGFYHGNRVAPDAEIVLANGQRDLVKAGL